VRKFISSALIAVVALLLLAACAETGSPAAQVKSADPPAQPKASGPPAHPKFELTGLMAEWVDPKTGLNVNNDMWNCPQRACGRQLVWANSSSDWGVVSTMAKGNTAVLAYPAVQEQFGANNQPAPLSNARELLSTFTEAMPTSAGTIGEAAYDIWLNGWNTEVMIWVDNQHQRFEQPVVATATFHGQTFTVYRDPGTSHGYPSGPIFFVLNHNETSGTVDILAVFRWLQKSGFLTSSAGLNAVDFGWEICSTNGGPENFAVSRYTLSVKGLKLSAESRCSQASGRAAQEHNERDRVAERPGSASHFPG
jgi:hypothetical protein